MFYKKISKKKKNWGESSDSANKFFVDGFEKKKKVIFSYITAAKNIYYVITNIEYTFLLYIILSSCLKMMRRFLIKCWIIISSNIIWTQHLCRLKKMWWLSKQKLQSDNKLSRTQIEVLQIAWSSLFIIILETITIIFEQDVLLGTLYTRVLGGDSKANHLFVVMATLSDSRIQIQPQLDTQRRSGKLNQKVSLIIFSV